MVSLRTISLGDVLIVFVLHRFFSFLCSFFRLHQLSLFLSHMPRLHVRLTTSTSVWRDTFTSVLEGTVTTATSTVHAVTLITAHEAGLGHASVFSAGLAVVVAVSH